MKKQVYNPFLPLNEYIPDGEPHVFGDRVYLFGSHDQEAGETYCMLDYVFYSAPVDDLSDWTCKGVNYSGKWDPSTSPDRTYLYAPDVVRGNDGRYYLYYSLSGTAGTQGYFGPMGVAVCDTPDGKYTYLGNVRNQDGSDYKRFIPFDPAVINDDGVIRLYYGSCYPFDNMTNPVVRALMRKVESKLFGKTVAEIKAENGGIMGPITVELEDDMMTIKSEPKRILPTKTVNTPFEKHAFFEGSSIRKINGIYYFIYSSFNNHELCYATSRYPDRDFEFRGTIVSNGDIGYEGIQDEDRRNNTGTTHGSIEQINGQWYVFYHRQTHKSDYSRQACAEPITIEKDGTIKQVEMTSCGLNGGPLSDKGTYPAVICCNLTNGKMPHNRNGKTTKQIPCVTSADGEQFIGNITENTSIGYKYFDFATAAKVSVKMRGAGEGKLIVRDSYHGKEIGAIVLTGSTEWVDYTSVIKRPEGKSALFFEFHGKGKYDLKEFALE